MSNYELDRDVTVDLVTELKKYGCKKCDCYSVLR